MQPETSVVFDKTAFDRLKSSISGLTKAAKGRKLSSDYGSPIPLDIGVELTTRCNLRCGHCFLWNEEGLYQKDPEFRHKDLPYSIMEKVLKETEPQKSNLFFWGTEPLIYRYWDALSRALEKDKRWTVVCTNGTLIEKKMESLLRISDNLATVISIDGLESAHDAIRGEGEFKRAIKNVELLLERRKKGEYKGQITLHTVLNKEIIPHLYEYCLFAESLGIDSLYIGFPWHINSETAKKMDHYVEQHLSFIPQKNSGPKSWQTYLHSLDKAYLPELKQALKKINSRVWKMRFRFQPALEIHELEDFLDGGEKTAQGRSECYAVSNRMDIRADGTVTSCQCYPELVVGDLAKEGVIDIWHGEKIKKVREAVSKKLMPVCSKCILLYLNGK